MSIPTPTAGHMPFVGSIDMSLLRSECHSYGVKGGARSTFLSTCHSYGVKGGARSTFLSTCHSLRSELGSDLRDNR